jgi:hypothetical protein
VLFQIGTPAGYVSHAAPRLLRQHLAIASGPLIVSSLLSVGLFASGLRLSLAKPGSWWPLAALMACWLGLSVALEAWPSAGDASALRRSAAVRMRLLDLVAPIALLISLLLLGVSRTRGLYGHWLYAVGLALVAARLSANIH